MPLWRRWVYGSPGGSRQRPNWSLVGGQKGAVEPTELFMSGIAVIKRGGAIRLIENERGLHEGGRSVHAAVVCHSVAEATVGRGRPSK